MTSKWFWFVQKNKLFVPIALQIPIPSITQLAVCMQFSTTVPPQTIGSIWLSDISVLFCTSCTVGLCSIGQLLVLTLWGPVACQGGHADVTEVSDLSLAAGNGTSTPHPKNKRVAESWTANCRTRRQPMTFDFSWQLVRLQCWKEGHPCTARTSEAVGSYLLYLWPIVIPHTSTQFILKAKVRQQEKM